VTLKNLGIDTTREAEVGTGPTSSATERSESLTQQGDKSAKRGKEGLLSLLSPPHTRSLESHALKQGCGTKGESTQERPWLEVLKSLEGKTAKEDKRRTNTGLSPYLEEVPESLIQRGAKSPPPSPHGEGTSGVNAADVNPTEARRTLVTTSDQLAEAVADLKDVGLVALDLETTGLHPRKDSIRLLSSATEDATYIVDCQSVEPAELFPILAERSVVAHNALFDVGFFSSLGFEPGKVADTMILSHPLPVTPCRFENRAPEEGTNFPQS